MSFHKRQNYRNNEKIHGFHGLRNKKGSGEWIKGRRFLGSQIKIFCIKAIKVAVCYYAFVKVFRNLKHNK